MCISRLLLASFKDPDVNNPVRDENASIASRKGQCSIRTVLVSAFTKTAGVATTGTAVEKETTAEEISTSITLNIIRDCVCDQKTLLDQPHICTLDPVYEDD
ncbi:hypothetical protein OS493_010858 [Desmophyllum pertusum]|uniref:Uncharacterized protein n=1 Tax=Desmophyllum pertusum TaxID=174260 RepID=A0A9W9ZEE6_9CNID|nr:hypothetical protein OS493_010858 [Desmophyllum pertusum]